MHTDSSSSKLLSKQLTSQSETFPRHVNSSLPSSIAEPRIHDAVPATLTLPSCETQTLAPVAEFLGIQPSALENAFSYKTLMVKKELCTIFLHPDGAYDLAKTPTLYCLLVCSLYETQMMRVCPTRLEGRAVKMQVRRAWLGAVVARCGSGSAGARGGVWEVGVEIGEFWKRYHTPLSALGVSVPEGALRSRCTCKDSIEADVVIMGPVQGEQYLSLSS